MHIYNYLLIIGKQNCKYIKFNLNTNNNNNRIKFF